MKRGGSQAGLTIVELSVSAVLSVAVLIAAGSMLDASGKVAQSTNDQGIVTRRTDNSLSEIAETMRRGSLASARHLDGTNFSAGSTDTGVQVRTVTDFQGHPITSALIGFRWDSTTRELLRVDGAISSVLARDVTAFSVGRTGDLFTLTLSTQSGPSDDRRRAATGVLQVIPRNP